MQTPKIMNYPMMKVAMRKDFYEKFASELKALQEKAGALLFAHTIIEDYRGPNHKVSTFNSNEDWHELYWDKYWNEDPLETTCHQAANTHGSGITSWQVIDPQSECMKARMSLGGAQDGIMLAFKHPSGLMENISFGWESGKNTGFIFDKLEMLTKIIEPLRSYHQQSYQTCI